MHMYIVFDATLYLYFAGYVPAALWRKFPSIGASLQTTAITLELSEKAKKDFLWVS